MAEASKRFPILKVRYLYERDSEAVALLDQLPASLPWEMVEAYEDRAQTLYGQSLETLAARRGLTPWELHALWSGRSRREMFYEVTLPESVAYVWQHIEDWNTLTLVDLEMNTGIVEPFGERRGER